MQMEIEVGVVASSNSSQLQSSSGLFDQVNKAPQSTIAALRMFRSPLCVLSCYV